MMADRARSERGAQSKGQVHEPVLLKEVLQYLDPQPGDFMIDGTMDGGGHARAVMMRIDPGGKFLGVDWDRGIIERAKKSSATIASRVQKNFVHGNYADLPEILAREKLPRADGLLLDLGFSSEQLALSGRGFSFAPAAADEPLLMTYDDARTPVAEILRGMGETELADIVYKLGGERMSRRIAKAIVERERRRPIKTSGELAETIRATVPGNYERGRIDPATRTFQALRIYANDEFGNIKKILKNLDQILAPGGRVAIITFHSLEDRIVKQEFQSMEKEKKLKILTKKPIPTTRDEIFVNPRSRSAKLRAAVWAGV